MDFEKYLKSIAKKLDLEIEKIFKDQLEEASRTDKKLMPLIFAFSKSCHGGKRIRGALVELGYEIGKQASGVRRQASDILKIGAAYEILHGAILVHDDIIDQSLIRRDKPSLYQVLGGNHYGISQALSLGDYGFFLSYKIICKANFPDKHKIKALIFFSQAMMNTGWGEMLDLEDVDPIIVMKLKTACYTISGPLQLGAILGEADAKLIRLLGEFGENLGIAYQIRDDILDEEEKSKVTEKTAKMYEDKALKVLPQVAQDPKMSKLLQQMVKYLVERKE